MLDPLTRCLASYASSTIADDFDIDGKDRSFKISNIYWNLEVIKVNICNKIISVFPIKHLEILGINQADRN